MTMHKKHHYRELLSIGFPIIIGQLGTIILGFADTLMIGHHSTPELAAALLSSADFTERNAPTSSVRRCATPSLPTC